MDQLLEFLLKKASITETQFETMILWMKEGRVREKASLRKRGPVSKGAFWRTLSQGRGNVESSLYTVLLMSYAGIVPAVKFTQLARVGSLMQEIRKQRLGEGDLRRVQEATEQFVMEFSGRRNGYL